MIIGILTLEISIFDARSLKDKRSVIKGLKDRLRNKYNVSVSEVGRNDNISIAILGIATVSNDSRFTQSSLSKVVDFVRKIPKLSLVDYSIELL